MDFQSTFSCSEPHYHEDVANPLHSSNSAPKTRAACDSCREQKLKCVIPSQSNSQNQCARCLRCISSGSHCHFSLPKRSGRPRLQHPTAALETTKTPSESSHRRPSYSATTCHGHDSSDPEKQDMISEIDSSFSYSGLGLPRSEASQSFSPPGPVLANVAAPSCSGEYFGVVQPEDVFNDWVGPRANDNYSGDAQMGPGHLLHEETFMASLLDTALNERAADVVKPLANAKPLIHELAEMNLRLGAQVEETKRPALQPDFEYAESLASTVLDSSFRFVDLLEKFHAAVQPRVQVHQAKDVVGSSLSSVAPELSYSPTPTTVSTFADSRRPSVDGFGPAFGPGAGMAASRARPTKVDMACVLQLLSCFVYVIQLHSLVYLVYQNCLAAAKVSHQPGRNFRNNSFPPLFPKLEIRGVSLARTSSMNKFHIKLLLQICAHTLGEIETLLGLPDGYRVSDRPQASHQCGILEASVSLQLVQAVTREAGLLDNDRITGIKKTLAGLRAELKGSVDI